MNVCSTTGIFPNGATKPMAAIFEGIDPLYDRIAIRMYGLADPIAIYRFEMFGDQEVIGDAVYFDRNQAILKKLKTEAAAAGEELAKPTIEYREVVEQRFYEVVYERLGDEFNAEDDRITFVKEGWRAEGDLKVLRVFGKQSD